MANIFEVRDYHLDETLQKLNGPTPKQLVVYNQGAAIALDFFHQNSKATFKCVIDGVNVSVLLNWNSNFSKAGLQEKKVISEYGGISLAFFVMSVLLNYKYAIQSEVGEGVDYNFKLEKPSDDNFLAASHYVEVSGILEETPTNNMKTRLAIKHKQIEKGTRFKETSSIVISIFNTPTLVSCQSTIVDTIFSILLLLVD